MIKIAVLASGEGTNLQALLDAAKAGRMRGEIALVLSSREQAGALARARAAGVPYKVLQPKDNASPEEYSAALAAECARAEIGLVCLAGFMMQLKRPLLSAYPDRILNVHPALLPAFGGKGMYGMRVHEAVLAAGARVSGCTVHFVDDLYDHGPILSQHAVPVLPGDTPQALAARVRQQEHWAYPEAVRLFCEGRVEIRDRLARVQPSPLEASGRLRRALVSVSDKSGLVELCRGLAGLGVEIVSTSGTAKALQEAGVAVRPLDALTGYPEILGGRVKTLHPKIHGGILLRRHDREHLREAEAMSLEPIDLVVVNLYPFAAAAARAESPLSRAVIEQIDIGGVTLLRAAAKSFEDVAALASPADYASVLMELEKGQGQLSLETRRRLALTAFRHTAEYDAAIAGYFESCAVPASPGNGAAPARAGDPPAALELRLERRQALRYGENPHQRAALYAPAGAEPSFRQLQGKELSYNNLLDAWGAWEAASDFEQPACALFKHATPCGLAVGKTPLEAFERAWACDPLSAFGGIVALNRPLGPEIAEILSKRFVEVLAAPAFEPRALDLLKAKTNLRVLERPQGPDKTLQLRSIGRELLVTEPDREDLAELKVATKKAPTPAQEAALRFAWKACKHVRSNAIVLAGPGRTVGIGAGQMSRVDSVHMAGVKYRMYLKDNPAPEPLVLASDAFFPFKDGIEAAATLGISAVIQPGGSLRDEEVVAAADALGLAMVFTGMRHFKH